MIFDQERLARRNFAEESCIWKTPKTLFELKKKHASEYTNQSNPNISLLYLIIHDNDATKC